MKIQQYKQFKLELYRYNLVTNSYYQNPISHLEDFLHYFFGYVNRAGGPIQFLNKLQFYQDAYNITFETVNFIFDKENNLIYLSEIFDPYELNITENEFKQKYSNMTALQLCKYQITQFAIISKKNFIHLLIKWENYFSTKKAFVLLYLDDQNKYDALPFDTEYAMEQFIDQHTKYSSLSKPSLHNFFNSKD